MVSEDYEEKFNELRKKLENLKDICLRNLLSTTICPILLGDIDAILNEIKLYISEKVYFDESSLWLALLELENKYRNLEWHISETIKEQRNNEQSDSDNEPQK